MAKKIIVVGFGAIAVGFSAYLIARANKVQRVIDKLTFSVKEIKRIRISGGKLKADLYLKVHNPTNDSIDLKTGVLKADELRIYEKGTTKTLAKSSLEINEVYLPAKGYFNLPAVNIQIPLLTGAVMALNQITSNKQNFLDKLTIELDLKALDYKKTIKIN